MKLVHNFQPGPSKLPKSVLDLIQPSINEYESTGKSILEIGHRSSEFLEILEKIDENMKSLFGLPENFHCLLMQGGATYQNTFISNNIKDVQNIGCIVSGTWGLKTYEDFSKVRSLVTKYEFDSLHELFDNTDLSNHDFVHLTSNETIEGIQIKNFNEIKSNNLIIDMSSDIGSYKFSFENIKYIYAGAQKNMGIPGVTICFVSNNFINENQNPSYLNLNKLIEKKSNLNTPPTFSIYVLKLITDWMLDMGGIEYFENKSLDQSRKIYEILENNDSLLDFNTDETFRSSSNVVFRFKNKDIDKHFLNSAEENGIIGLKGHRSIGGVRISLYNSIDYETFNILQNFMNQYFKSI